MEFCGMKREIDRKCFIHARVHANAQSFDRCERLGSISSRCSGKEPAFLPRILSLFETVTGSRIKTNVP